MPDIDMDVPSESEDEDSDWLKELSGDDPSPDGELPAEESSGQVSDPQSSQDAPAELPAPDDSGVPDWMIDGDATEAPQAETQSDEENDPPDWLNSIREAENQSQAEEELSAAQGPEESDGDWLERIRDSEQERLASEDPGEQEDENFIARIQSMEASEESSDGEDKEQPSADLLADDETAQSEDDEGPDWLSGLLVAPPTPPPEDVPEEEDLVWEDPVPASDDSGSTEEIPTQNGDQDLADIPIESESPATPEEAGFVDTGSLPSWLADMKRTGSLDDAVLSSEPASFAGEDEPAAQADGLADLELTPGDLPDWITEKSTDDEVDEEILAEEETSDEPPAEIEETETKDIASADMPKWLYGMRPIESPYAPVEGGAGVEETVGPLAGLLDVLPAEPEIVQFGKPPVYSMNLEVSNSQQQNAELFEQIISADSQSLKSKTKALALTQGALRWAIAGLIFVSLLVPVLSESTSMPLPTAIPPEEILIFQSLIKDLDQEDTVLVAFEYQPGMSGEMHAAASAVFDHLLLQGAQLVLVSTQPTGPALADIFLDQTQAAQHRYVAEKSYRDLGYFSGGNTALLNLALNPRLALPMTVTVEETDLNAWDMPPLQSINLISDFSMLIVITDDPETARNWIEQVQPSLGDTPLTMVLSAQAEPLVRPYFQSDPKKINGYVSGLLGGAYYESSIGRDHVRTARLYWNSYSTGLGVTVFIIFMGSLAETVSYLLSRRKRSSSKAQL